MIYELVKNTLQNSLGIDGALINPQAMVEKDLQLDSTETVAIALELKKHLGVDFKFPKQDLTLQDLCDQVTELQAAKTAL